MPDLLCSSVGGETHPPFVLSERLAGRPLHSWGRLTQGQVQTAAITLARLHERVRPLTSHYQTRLSHYPIDDLEARLSSGLTSESVERLLTTVASVEETTRDTLCHRDFHPGNLIWRGDTLTGVVDWTTSMAGPAWLDVAHFRVNLLVRDPSRIDAAAFLTTYSQKRELVYCTWHDAWAAAQLLATEPVDSPRYRVLAGIAGAEVQR